MKFAMGKKGVGGNNPVLIVAELSCNHMQDFKIAVRTIRAMKESGADAVKLQTYTPDTITFDSDNKFFQIKQGTLWNGTTLHKLYQKTFMPWEWHSKLKKIAEDIGLICFSTPFDKTAVDFLENMDMPCYKVASFEITDIPLIEHIASKRKPVIMSTGVATLADIKEAIAACHRKGNNKIALLKCTSSYPAPFETVNLRTIPDMARVFNAITGLSDHTLGISVPIGAVALGAKIIEKHFILDRRYASADAAFSLQPHEFKAMVRAIREIEAALGRISYELTGNVKKNRQFCRSLFAVEDIKAEEVFTEKNVRSVRPGYGLPPKCLKKVLGKKANKNIKKGTPLGWKLISGIRG